MVMVCWMGHFMRRTCTGIRGFTLIELLVVISIIALLVALLLPALGLAKEMGRRAVCASGVHQMVLAIQMYAQDNQDEIPGRSGYNFATLDYFRPGPGGTASNAYGDFSGIYPHYAPSPDIQYCPSGPWTQHTSWGEGEAYTVFYTWNPWHGIWGRLITYNYFGNQSMDFAGKSPPLDFNGDIVEYPLSISDEPHLVRITDANWYSESFDGYGRSMHPSNPINASAERDYSLERAGINLGRLDGSVKWRHESDTLPRYQIRTGGGGWWARH